MDNIKALQATIAQMSTRGKGLLAADESVPTITKRLQAIGVESTEDTRRAYRDLLLSTQDINAYLSGVILFEETLNQTALDGTPFPMLLQERGIVPGIKVDKGLVAWSSTNPEQVTQGLDGLAERLQKYKAQGAQFAKWRAVYTVGETTPSKAVNAFNAMTLARYAQICQDNGIVPIVEPEVLIDGAHTIEQCEKVSEKVLAKVFKALRKYGVILEYIILKPSMVIAGKKCSKQASVAAVAEATMRVLKRTVPAAVPSINFLSGGQTALQATQHLQAMNAMGALPWHLSFSYARALQEPCMDAWRGKSDNKKAAQTVLLQRAKLNHLATLGQYSEKAELA
ncbi:MAG: fructose-bisphosphate aldolase class I [Gammaproteobacteria bacterium CG_4_10_14_0_8_um_filter_38_16]|nr:MAG: fructose-bisphosphate aldolase class I [Gammaproteobacteria bacterium CG_4_10_14_0_8_um_filter_38_16]PJA03847.1 MAG: fructose-bisphosphate aldolase class I [Gammaproteobacteria bacterium CG_4_10_14_0_2_um_filter_38_22]PJB10821.1 MAG: fructose-bisphosphate aldolase class I [Gammaproteobacteria bacterium CG_4_9_14_3_um_filter_38_9]